MGGAMAFLDALVRQIPSKASMRNILFAANCTYIIELANSSA